MKIQLKTFRNLKQFLQAEQISGILLLVCTVLSVWLANSSFSSTYLSLWHTEIFKHSIVDIINDGLMAIFFLYVGLEIKREFISGELSSFQKASLPIGAALGGMIVPACLFLVANYGKPTESGWGIPMATDIAFSIGVLSLFGSRIPTSLKIFLTALAVADDLGAVVVIALFYSSSLQIMYLLLALLTFGSLLLLNKLKVHRLIWYLLLGAILWIFIVKSGIHSTIAGVLLAFAIPYHKDDTKNPLLQLEHVLQNPVSYFIMPIFALANTGIVIEGNFLQGMQTPDSIGILLGLCLGKPIGILLFSLLAIKTKLSHFPENAKLVQFIAVACLCGIGFTMSIFISTLAYTKVEFIDSSKITVLVASAISATIGSMLLLLVNRKR